MKCNHCAAEFVPNRKTSKFCSKVCKDESYRLILIERRKLNPNLGKCAKHGDCKHCDKPFTYYQTKTADFCSRACSAVYRSERTAPKHSELHLAECSLCLKDFTSRYKKSVCNSCVSNKSQGVIYSIIKGTRERQCNHCSVSFSVIGSNHHAQTCSVECLNEIKRAERRKYKARRRAVERGAKADTFDPIDIFKRDKWKCQCCKVKLKPINRGLNLPLSPELDHITPLSKGGAHTRANTQLLCRSCNNAKSNNHFEGEQMLLVG